MRDRVVFAVSVLLALVLVISCTEYKWDEWQAPESRMDGALSEVFSLLRQGYSVDEVERMLVKKET
ncbi:hypothetical protein R83H12_01860 [Fibrobacteria bacterium R8-3-H12]